MANCLKDSPSKVTIKMSVHLMNMKGDFQWSNLRMVSVLDKLGIGFGIDGWSIWVQIL